MLDAHAIRCRTAEARGSLLDSLRTVNHRKSKFCAKKSRVTFGCIDYGEQDESSCSAIDSIACRKFASVRTSVLGVQIPLHKGFRSTLSGFIRDGDVCNRKTVVERMPPVLINNESSKFYKKQGFTTHN